MATNQQRREAAKRKLERQLEYREQRTKRNRIIGVGATVGVVVLAVGLIVFLTTRDGEEAPPAAADDAGEDIKIPTERAEVPERPKALEDPATCKYPKAKEAPGQPESPKAKAPENGEVPAKGTVDVTMQTSAGDIGLTLDRALAPCTVNSMVNLIEQGFYDKSECHRLVTEGIQVLQCGDPTGTGAGGPGYSFKDETFKEIKYGRGLLAMANSGPDTNGSQFFMVYGEAQLNPDYTVFGSVSDSGLKVLDKIAKAGVDKQAAQGGSDGPPKTPVTVKKITMAS